MQGKALWSLWQELVLGCALGFTRVGRLRFLEWVTGLALNVEEHTITQSLLGLGRPQDWKALESFAEYGSWGLPSLEEGTARLVLQAKESLWHGYHVWAGDDTKVLRHSKEVWGSCPNRA